MLTVSYLFLYAPVASANNTIAIPKPILITSTVSPIPTITPIFVPSVPDAQFYKNLIDTYNDNTTLVLDIVKWVIVISGGGGVYFYLSGNSKINEANNSIELLRQELKQLTAQSGGLQDSVKIVKDEIRNFEEKLKEFSTLADGVQKNIKAMRQDAFRQQYLVNLKSTNSSLRLSAVQKLGYEGCEDLIVSTLVERLNQDNVDSIRIEASASIGRVLCSEVSNGHVEQPAFQYGLSGLFEVLTTENLELKEEILRSLVNLHELGYSFSRAHLNKLRMASQKLSDNELKKDVHSLFVKVRQQVK